MSHVLVGGLGQAKPADDTVAAVVNQVKEALLEKVTTNNKRPHLTTKEQFEPCPHSYKTQLVAGTNFFVKVKVTEGDFIHVRIYRDLQGNVDLHSVAEDKTEADEITYF